MQLVFFSPRLLLAAGHIQVVVEQLPAQFLDGRASGGSPPGVDVDQVGQRCASSVRVDTFTTGAMASP